MSDRWEDLSTASVKCYIYNSKATTPEIITTGNVIETGNTIPETIVTPPTTNTLPPTTPTHNANTTPPPVVVPQPTPPSTPPSQQTPPPAEIITPQQSVNKNISLTFDKLTSDLAKHFITQNDLVVSVVSKSPLKAGEEATITLEITKKT